MNNLLQPVLERYPKYLIEKQLPPSYVQIFTKDTNEIVLVLGSLCKDKNKSTFSNDYGTKINKAKEEELDLTGSPLKLDLSLHTTLDDTMVNYEPQMWSKEEGTHIPISIEKAREIANLYNANISKSNDTTPMWILTDPLSSGKPLLLTVQSDENNFARGLVNYEDTVVFDDVHVDEMVEEFAKGQGIDPDLVNVTIDCKYLLSGISIKSHNVDELLNAPQSGLTELSCEWSTKTLQTPFISCKVLFEQAVIIGHLLSPCNAIWKSVCALHNINQMLVDMTAAGIPSVNLETTSVRNTNAGIKRPNNTKRLNQLLNETETYAFTAEYPPGGCISINEDTNSLKQCLTAMNVEGSSNDFTYKLWDILRDCESAEELITLLIQALKFISSGKIRPFIDANNKTYLSKLVLKLSRGHSQAPKVLKNLRTSPAQALSLAAQVGIEKTMWEYTRIMTLLEHSFFIAGIWSNEAKSQESIDQINQTIQDMTMSGGDFSLNPFESISTAENSIRLDCESFYEDDPNELSVDDFASLKKHGLVGEKKDVNEVPLIADEIDISPWKNLLTKFSQVHVCLEHLYRAETCLRADFANLKPLTSFLLEHYVGERSPVKTIGQLTSDPVQQVTMPITNNIVHDLLKKPAFWYRVELSRKEKSNDNLRRTSKMVYVYSQQPVFPPSVWQSLEPATEEIGEVTTVGVEVKYHCTKYTFISNKIRNKIAIP